MESHSTLLESELSHLTPTPISSSLLDRLDGAMKAAAAEVSNSDDKIIEALAHGELSSLEESLRDLVPYGVPENMISRLDEAMSRWHEEVPLDEKIVSIKQDPSEKRAHWIGLRSVATVALLGAGVAFMPQDFFNKPAAMTQRIPVLPAGNTSLAVFTPNTARASVVSASDHGVVWTKSGQPLRCLEVQVNNEFQFVNEKGEMLTLKQPKTEVRFTPVKFD
jgi:hypothetical protein